MPHLAPEDDANKDDEGEGAHTSSDAAHGTEAGGSSSASVSSSISAVVALALLAILFA